MRSFSKYTKWFVFLFALAALSSCSRDPNVRKQKFLESGKKYFQQNKYPEAIIEFQNAIQVDKNFAPAHYQLALCFLKQALWTNAYRELSLTVALEPTNWDAQLDIANLLFGAHQFAEARDRALSILNSNPTNLGAQLLLASSDAGLGNMEEAIHDAEQAVQIAPDKPSPYLTLGLLQEQSTQVAAAEQNLQKAVETDPKFLAARLGLGGFYQRQKKWAQAEEQFKAGIEADPNSPMPRISLASLYIAWEKKGLAEQTMQSAKTELHGDSGSYRILGDYYIANGETEKARAEFASLLHDHPKDVVVRERYVQLLIQAKQFDDALKIEDEILAQNSKDAEALVLKGQTLNLMHKPAEAVSILETAVRSNPDDSSGHYQLGFSYAMTENTAGAEKEWREATRLKPSLLDAQQSLASLALRKGDFDLLDQCATALLKYAPAAPEGYLYRGTTRMSRHDFAGAEEDFRKALSINPKNAMAYTRLGETRAAQGRPAEAEKLYNQALENDPHSNEALQQLVSLYIQQKHPETAVNKVREQIAKAPENSNNFLLLGQALLADHKDSEAQAAFSKAVDLDSKNLQSLLLLAQSQERSGQIDAAASNYERAIQNNPKDVRAYVALGTLEERRGNWQNAQKVYQNALQVQSDQPAAANNLSYLLLEHGGNLDYALELAQIARRAMPDSANTADTLAWAYYKKGIYNSAIDLLEEVTKKVPRNSTYFYHLGLAYEKSNKVEQARNTFQHALQIDAKSPQADQIRQALSELTSN